MTGPAFSYRLHVPDATRSRPGHEGFRLLVVVHDTTRNARACSDAFAEFGDQHGCLVLAPLFPASASEPADPDNYKFIVRQLRFDLVLLDMVTQIARSHRVDTRRFLMHGFSGGAQFVHRFLYLHPERVAAASIAAPGRVTPLDFSKPWWAGVADVAEVLGGRPVDLAALRAVAVQVLVGEDDTGPVEPGDPAGHAGATGLNRVQRAGFLHSSLAGHGVRSRLDVVPGAGHEYAPLLACAQRFLAAAASASINGESCQSY
jgi:poly(3-hydroxybutyrate) depolymerase